MNTENIKRLRRVHLFAGLSVKALEIIKSRGTIRCVRKNTVFIECGDTSTTLYLILSGKIKVYVQDGQGKEQVLRLHGPGEHLGELAMLTDAVRTASAVTLEDSELLVLSRREFIECLTDCPQIALNLDQSLDQHALSPSIGEQVVAQYRAWSRFRHSRLPMIILIGGCTGTGKSTVAAELAMRLDIGRIQSTDILRDVARLFVYQQIAPELHVSSYDAWRVLNFSDTNDLDQVSKLIVGFRAQSDKLAETIDAVIERSVKERASIIIEGIHIHPGFYRRVIQKDAVVVPLLLTNSSAEKLIAHFHRRGEVSPSRSASRYLNNISAIMDIQDYLITEAQHYGVSLIPNTDFDDTLTAVIGVITECLKKRFL